MNVRVAGWWHVQNMKIEKVSDTSGPSDPLAPRLVKIAKNIQK